MGILVRWMEVNGFGMDLRDRRNDGMLTDSCLLLSLLDRQVVFIYTRDKVSFMFIFLGLITQSSEAKSMKGSRSAMESLDGKKKANREPESVHAG